MTATSAWFGTSKPTSSKGVWVTPRCLTVTVSSRVDRAGGVGTAGRASRAEAAGLEDKPEDAEGVAVEAALAVSAAVTAGSAFKYGAGVARMPVARPASAAGEPAEGPSTQPAETRPSARFLRSTCIFPTLPGQHSPFAVRHRRTAPA